MKLLTTYVCIVTYRMLGHWVELAAVPAALKSICYRYSLSACTWLANNLSNYIFIKLVEESSSARERQNCPAIG